MKNDREINDLQEKKLKILRKDCSHALLFFLTNLNSCDFFLPLLAWADFNELFTETPSDCSHKEWSNSRRDVG